MPADDRRRERRHSHDPESDGDRRRRPSDPSQRRRRGHRATDSTGELLPKGGGAQYDSSANSTPRKSRHSTPASGSASQPLNPGGLARLDALNHKKDRKRGWDTYDEAYLQEVRAKETELETERRRKEREATREKARRGRAGERRREEEETDRRQRDGHDRRHERGGRRRRDEDSTPRDSPRAHREQRRNKKRQNTDTDQTEAEEFRTHIRLQSDRSKPSPKKDHRSYERIVDQRHLISKHQDSSHRKKRRLISGPYLEDGRAEKVYNHRKHQKGIFSQLACFDLTRRRIIYISVALGALLLIVAICAGVVASKKSTKSQSTPSSTSNGKPANSNLNGISPDSIPPSAKGGYLDPFTWYDTVDFNVTYTDASVGGLPIMGLNSTWDDSVQANPGVPPLNQPFGYGTTPIRGMNVGGWLSIEPFITPSFFSKWSFQDGVIDEYTLTQKLAGNAAMTIEPHYSSFITKDTFSEIRAAGFDHVRISFSYWAVTTYSGDPYIAKISWRYLLRGIEYARQNGLRVNLDLHGLPGSQNGWNHSGRQGDVGWLNGPDGDLNAQRSLDIHNQLSQFFAQPRYKNVVTMYGLVNEPKMVQLDTEKVLNWTETAIRLVRANNVGAVVVFGDGFLGLDKWQGQLGQFDNLLLDVHQYVIFNDDQIVLKHSDKLNFACGGWTAQTLRSENTSTGFGPTLCGEWSQADTDCALYLNDVGVGSRWEGTLNSPNASLAVTTPQCPTRSGSPACECADANADPGAYSAVYKQWLLAFAEAQMQSFERGWGWFYWTWQTEGAVQWSWKLGAAAGILPAVATQRSFSCGDTIPDYGALGLPENY